MRTSLLKRRRGFTLIELLVVIVIVALLMAIAIPAYLSQQKKAKDSQSKQYLATVWKSARAAALENNNIYPTGATLIAIVNQDQPQISLASGTCNSASGNPNQILLDPSSTPANLVICSKSGSGTIHKMAATPTDAPSFQTVSSTAPYAAAVLADNPSLYLRMNDAGATAVDASTGAHNGTNASITNSVAHAFVTEPSNTSYSFAGNASSLTSVSAGTAPDYDSNFTIEFWVKTPTPVAGNFNHFLLGKSAVSGVRSGWWITVDKSGFLEFNGTISTCSGFADNTWHLIDVRFDNTFTAYCYIDGVSVGGNGSLSGGVTNTSAPVEIGGSAGFNDFLPGASVDEFALYPGLLSPARMLAHYAQR